MTNSNVNKKRRFEYSNRLFFVGDEGLEPPTPSV